MDFVLYIFPAFVGVFVIVVIINTLSRFPDTTFKVFTFVLGLFAYTFALSIGNEFVKLVFLVFGSLTLFAGFGTLFVKQ